VKEKKDKQTKGLNEEVKTRKYLERRKNATLGSDQRSLRAMKCNLVQTQN